MGIEGRRIRKTRYVATAEYVVAVEVDLVYPVDDPSEPCYEPETVNLLRDVKHHVEAGDLEWLKGVGKVYAAIDDTP